MNMLSRFPRRRVVPLILSASLALAGAAVPQDAQAQSQPVARSSDPLELRAGFAEILRIEGDVGTIVLGNPNVADASPVDGRSILVTGLAAGRTNMIVLGAGGEVLARFTLSVSSRDPDAVTVRRGVTAEIYSCAEGICASSSTSAPAAATPPPA